jgi:hypothetical protein
MSNIPPRAEAPGITGQLPLAPGKPMVMKSVSPGERAILEAAGWKEGEAVPDNIGEIIVAAENSATNLEAMPPPGDLRTPELAMPEVQNIEDLSKEKQDKYSTVIQAIKQSQAEVNSKSELDEMLVEGGDPSINDAIRAANKTGVLFENDLDSDTYASGTPKTETLGTAQRIKEDELKECPHCGWDLDLPDTTEASPEDRLAFMQSTLGLQPFYKDYSLFGGNMVVTYRSLSMDEIDLVFKQMKVDNDEDRISGWADNGETLRRYRTAMQITRIVTNGAELIRPRTLEEWEKLGLTYKKPDSVIRAIWEDFSKNINTTETLHRILLGTGDEFNQLVVKLEENSKNADFWKAINTDA